MMTVTRLPLTVAALMAKWHAHHGPLAKVGEPLLRPASLAIWFRLTLLTVLLVAVSVLAWPKHAHVDRWQQLPSGGPERHLTVLLVGPVHLPPLRARLVALLRLLGPRSPRLTKAVLPPKLLA